MSTAIYTSPEDAEEAFYDAISRADLDALMGVWSEDEDIVCIHPTGQRLAGHPSIRESWRNVFENNQRFRVHLKHSMRWKGVLHAVHSVVEVLYLGDDATPHGPMLSTNVYQRGANGWRLLMRHTSAGTEESAEDNIETAGHTSHTLH